MAQTEYEKELTRRKKKDEETKYNQWLDTQRQDSLFQEDKLNNQANRFTNLQDSKTRSSMFDLEQKKYNDAADNEYYRKKDAFKVRGGVLDQDTFDTLYGGGGQGGQSGGGRGMRGGGQGGEPDYAEMITKAYANKPEDDMRSFADFAKDEMGSLRKNDLFPQAQQPMSTADAYKAMDLRNRMNFEQNVQSSRGYDGKLRFSDNAASPILSGASAQAQGWDASRAMAQNRMSMFTGKQNQSMTYDPSMEQKRSISTTPAAQRGTSITLDSTGTDPFLTAQRSKRPPYKLQHGDYTAFTSSDYATGVRSRPPAPPQSDGYDGLRNALRKRRNPYGM